MHRNSAKLADVTAIADPAPALVPGPSPADPPNSRILVIDDAQAIHDDFRKILVETESSLDEEETALFGAPPPAAHRVHFSLDSARQGDEGLRLVQRAFAEGRPYAMAFVDMRMPPGWDGLETIGRLWQTDPDLQVVLCTAYSDYSWEELTDRLGRADSLLILKKPFDTIEVLQLAHALTKKWMLTRQSKSRLDDLDQLANNRTEQLRASNQKLQKEIAERVRTEEALRAAQARLNYLVTQSPAVIYSLKTDGEKDAFSWTSESIFQITGYTAAEACRPDWWSTHVHPGDLDEAVSGRTRILADDKFAVEYRIRHKDGQYRWVRDEQRVARDAGGRPAEIVGTLMDITERKLLEERLRQSQKMEAVGQLAGGIAHDFNNLLLVMRGHAELLLLRNGEHSPQTTESLKQITTAAERAAGLTRQLLAFSRKQVMQPQPLLLNDVVANLTKMLQRVIGEHIQLQCHYAPQLAHVEADAGMLEQVLVNLVVNARDAMPDGGRLLITTAEATFDQAYARVNHDASAGTFVCLTVSDTGAGIAPEHLPRIFEPFFTTKEVGKGTGLGLATVYGIIKQHHGWIDVSSQPGAGATFKIYLPAVKAPPAPAAKGAPEKEPRGGAETILLVEDDEPVRSLTRRLLENFGYRVREAASGREALAKWNGQSAEFDLLLSDIVMPQGVSGLDLAARFRTQRPALKVVFMSGYPAEAAGKDPAVFCKPRTRFLQKPSPWRDLLRTVRQCLDEE
jgi:PAS domain S-box-containing protein